MLGLVVLKVEAKNNAKEKAEGLYNFFFAYGRNDETRDFFHNLGNEQFVEVPDEFRDKLDRTNFKHFVRKPTNKEIIKMLGGNKYD